MLYIMRHGQTDWNVQKRLQGQTDIPLNETGRLMARQAAQECENVHFDVCYCSPLSRARETAEILLCGRQVPIIVDNRLAEMCFGEYEGLKDSFLLPDCPINALFLDPENYVSTGGAESFEQLFARTGEFLRQVALPQVREGKDVIILGHGAMNLSITCIVKNKPLRDFWSEKIENCKLVELIHNECGDL